MPSAPTSTRRPLLQLLRDANVEFTCTKPLDSVWVAGLSDDSRRVEKENLFVAVDGTADDGHHFIAQAVDSGAGAVVLSDPSSIDERVPTDVPARVEAWRLFWSSNLKDLTSDLSRSFFGTIRADFELRNILRYLFGTSFGGLFGVHQPCCVGHLRAVAHDQCPDDRHDRHADQRPGVKPVRNQAKEVGQDQQHREDDGATEHETVKPEPEVSQAAATSHRIEQTLCFWRHRVVSKAKSYRQLYRTEPADSTLFCPQATPRTGPL